MELDISDHVANYLNQISSEKAKKKIWRWLERLKNEGYKKLLSTKDVVKLEGYGKDLYELRIIFNNILYRIFFIITDRYELIHAFNKHVGEKTPQKEISICLKRIYLNQ